MSPTKPDDGQILAGRHVLVVEDVAILAYALVDDLEAAGAVPVGPGMSVAEALMLIATVKHLDAALLNVDLRGESSFPVAAELLKRDIPFIFVTGDQDAVKEHYPDVPNHSKPADMAAIVKSLAGLFAG